METLSKKLELCKVCKNRKFDPSCGIVCGLTNEKPNFEDECADHVADEHLVKQQELVAKATKDEQSLDGKMPGSNWFLWIAGLSILNIGLYFIHWRFFFGLGTTQIFQELMLLDIMPISLSIVCMLLLPAFFLWTWWATAKKGIKLFYKIGWTVFLIDSIIYLTLCILGICSNFSANAKIAYPIFITIVDIVLHIYVLFYGFKLSQLKQIEGNTASSAHKAGYISYLVISMLVAISSLIYSVINSVVSYSTTTIEYAIKTIEAELPTKIDEYTTFEKIDRRENEIRIEYTLTNINLEELDPSFIETYPVTAKQEILNNIQNASPFEIMCWEIGYTITYVYRIDSNVVFDITITPKEYMDVK